MKYLFWLILAFSHLYSSVILDNKITDIEEFELEYFTDISKHLKFKDVIKEKFVKTKNKKSINAQYTNIWIKIHIRNITKKSKSINILNTTAYMNYKIRHITTDIKNNIIDDKTINFETKKGLDTVKGTISVHKVNLKPQQEVIVYINIISYMYQYYEILIIDDKILTSKIISYGLIITISMGILIGLMIYNFILFISTPFKEYLYYSLYILFAIIWVGFEFGFFNYYFHIYGYMIFYLNFSLVISSIFLIIFMKTILETPSKYPIENIFLNIIIYMAIITLIYASIDRIDATNLYDIVVAISFFIFVGISISIYKKKNPYVGYIIFAQFWLVLFSMISILFYEGFVEFNFINRYSAGIGIVFDAILLSYALSYKINVIDKENQSYLDINNSYKDRLNALNELLTNISHQWRQPLSNINSAVMDIDVELRKDNVSVNKIELKLEEIEDLAIYLSQTIDDFKDIYQKNQKRVLFDIKDVVSKSIKIVSFKFNKINIYIDIDENINIYGYPNHLKQVLFVLFNNSKDAFIDISNPQIHINLIVNKSNYILKFMDNGKGIVKSDIDNIFLENFSTKEDGNGIGLYMSKKILKEFMKADLYLEDSKYNTIFCIKFEKKDL